MSDSRTEALEAVAKAARLYVEHYICPSNLGIGNTVVRCKIHESDDPREHCFPCLFRDALSRLAAAQGEPEPDYKAERDAAEIALDKAWGLLRDLAEAISAHFDPPEGRRKAWPMPVYMAHRAATDAAQEKHDAGS